MIRVFGIGPGSNDWLPPIIQKSIAECDVLIGSERALALFNNVEVDKLKISSTLSRTIEDIRASLLEKKEIGVLVSGDPGFYSLLPMIRREFTSQDIEVYPGISSLQLAFARAGVSWQDALLRSVHGRSLETLPLEFTKPLFILTGGENTPQRIAQYFLKRGRNFKISIGNALGYPEEFWKTITAEELAVIPEELLNAVLIIYPENDFELSSVSNYNSQTNLKFGIGIPDSEFIRGKVPMTKEEVRVQVLAKAKILPGDNVLDVGAGTGSISIEASRLVYQGYVYAVEANSDAVDLIYANMKKFQIDNLKVISGKAPDVFASLPPVNVCIIGGSKGTLKEILKKVPLVSGGRVVITAITLENTMLALNSLKELGFKEIESISIQVVRWKEVSDLHIAEANNPIFIINALK